MIATTPIRKININALFKAVGIPTSREDITITETTGMYPYKKFLLDNWVYFSAFGFKRLKKILNNEQRNLSSFAIVGIGSGIDGIIASSIFKPTIYRLIVTDIDKEVLQGAVDNIRSNLNEHTEIELIPLLGSFCEPLMDANYEVDVIFGNIPNLPSPKEDLITGAEKGTFMPKALFDSYHPPEKFVHWALGSQYAYLQSAKMAIAENGSVITELGGRVPLTLTTELFHSCGFSLQEILVGFKAQTEAYEDFVGYHALEREYGMTFEFYRYQESIKCLHERNITNPTYLMSGEAIKRSLKPFQVTAGEALSLFQKGIPVGHTVHLFRGIPLL